MPDEAEGVSTLLDRNALVAIQCAKLKLAFDEIKAHNPFYRGRWFALSFDALRDPITKLPCTTRREIEEDQQQHPPYGTNLTYPLANYRRLHQTSGTTSANPLRWLDTEESWSWLKDSWKVIFRVANVDSIDRVFIPFSFGPFIGFWGAFEAANELRCFVLPAGGMSTSARLTHLLDNRATVICCTPTYALRLAEVARQENRDLASSSVRALIVAGEPGGHIPPTRQRIESAFGARVFDHAGMTEIGAYGFECLEAPQFMHVLETEFIAEVLDPNLDSHVADGQVGELVLTNLGRVGSPLIRYRTGDLVRMIRDRCACGRWLARLDGGILGRVDDMLSIRGNNVFPSAVEDVLRGFVEIAEFRMIADSAPTAELTLEIEPTPCAASTDLADRVVQSVRDRLNFRPTVRLVTAGSLPRFELKSRRLVRRDRATGADLTG